MEDYRYTEIEKQYLILTNRHDTQQIFDIIDFFHVNPEFFLDSRRLSEYQEILQVLKDDEICKMRRYKNGYDWNRCKCLIDRNVIEPYELIQKNVISGECLEKLLNEDPFQSWRNVFVMESSDNKLESKSNRVVDVLISGLSGAGKSCLLMNLLTSPSIHCQNHNLLRYFKSCILNHFLPQLPSTEQISAMCKIALDNRHSFYDFNFIRVPDNIAWFLTKYKGEENDYIKNWINSLSNNEKILLFLYNEEAGEILNESLFDSLSYLISKKRIRKVIGLHWVMGKFDETISDIVYGTDLRWRELVRMRKSQKELTTYYPEIVKYMKQTRPRIYEKLLRFCEFMNFPTANMILPFSVGDVYMGNTFDKIPDDAERILYIIQSYLPKYRNHMVYRIVRFFK